jgi:hypothetical protein
MNLSAETDNILYFTKNSVNTIIDNFLVQCIEPVTTNELLDSVSKYNLTWKNMHYIWKQYLSSINVPNMIYTNNLKTLLKTHLSFDEKNILDITFTNVTSKFLPIISSFLSFWESHITIIEHSLTLDTVTLDTVTLDTVTLDTIFDNEYEIDEIVSMYKNYLKNLCNTNTNTNTNINTNINNNACSDDEIIKIIVHYFSPSVEVIERKYVTNINCNMWAKQDDIKKMLNDYKQNKTLVVEELISFDDLYHAYRSYCRANIIVEKTVCLIVSKQFFEKYLLFFLHNYVKFDKFIGAEWLQ